MPEQIELDDNLKAEDPRVIYKRVPVLFPAPGSHFGSQLERCFSLGRIVSLRFQSAIQSCCGTNLLS